MRESADVLAKTILGLKNGDDAMNLSAVSTDMQEDLEKISPMVDRAEKNARTVLQQQKVLTEVGSALRNINRQSADLLEIAETVSSLKLQQNAAPTEISAAGQLVMLTQRIGKSTTCRSPSRIACEGLVENNFLNRDCSDIKSLLIIELH